MRLGFALAALIFAGLGAPASAATAFRHLVLDGHPVKWGQPIAGKGARITFALVASDTHFQDARNCAAIGPLTGLMTANAIGAGTLRREVDAAFKAWSDVADIQFIPASPGTADILIGAELVPLGRAFTNVAYDRASSGPGIRRIEKSLICLNPDRSWKVGFDRNLEVYDLRYTLIHEIGHAIGLDHPADAGGIMNFRYTEAFRTPQPGDIDGVVRLYGAPDGTPEPDIAATPNLRQPDPDLALGAN